MLFCFDIDIRWATNINDVHLLSDLSRMTMSGQFALTALSGVSTISIEFQFHCRPLLSSVSVIFSRVHATLHLAVSVGRSVGLSVSPSVGPSYF